MPVSIGSEYFAASNPRMRGSGVWRVSYRTRTAAVAAAARFPCDDAVSGTRTSRPHNRISVDYPAAPCCCQAYPREFWSGLGRDFWFSCEPPPCEGRQRDTRCSECGQRILLRRLAHRLPVSSFDVFPESAVVSELCVLARL